MRPVGRRGNEASLPSLACVYDSLYWLSVASLIETARYVLRPPLLAFAGRGDKPFPTPRGGVPPRSIPLVRSFYLRRYYVVGAADPVAAAWVAGKPLWPPASLAFARHAGLGRSFNHLFVVGQPCIHASPAAAIAFVNCYHPGRGDAARRRGGRTSVRPAVAPPPPSADRVVNALRWPTTGRGKPPPVSMRL